MRNFEKRIQAIVRGDAGETITETLVAMVIAALALAVVIASSFKIINQSRDYMDRYYSLNNDIAERSGTSTATGTVSLTIDAVGDGTSVSIPLSGSGSASVTYYYDSSASSNVIAYGKST